MIIMGPFSRNLETLTEKKVFSMVGVELPEAGILAVLPLVVLFNVTISLYTIPIGRVIAKAIRKNLRVGNMI